MTRSPALCQHVPRHRHRAVLAAIARREWLLRMLALGAASCARDHARSRPSMVILAYDFEELKPDADLLANYLLYLPLVRYDGRGNLQGHLAERWTQSADAREWTFFLRDVRWHDGVPVTAHDVKFTLELLMHPDLAEEAPGTWEAIDVLNDRTVRIRAGYYGHALLRTFVHYPRHLLQNVAPKAFYDSTFWLRPVGNGPYRFVRSVPQTMMELAANPEYYRGRPRIEHVVLRFSRTAGLSQLLAGEVDAMTIGSRAAVRGLTSDPRFRLHYWYRGERARGIYWNLAHPLFRDSRIRRALTLAINRPELLKVLELSPTVPIVDGFYTERQLLRGDLGTPLPYDPAGAAAMLDAAGWADRDRDGVRERDGRPFRFTALVNGSFGEEEPAIAVYVQDQLRRIGVRMELQPLEMAVVFPRVLKGAFEAAIMQIWRDPRWGRDDSPYGYRNPELAALIDRLDHTVDADGVDALHRRMTEIFRADVPATMLFPYVWTVVAHRRIVGLSSPFRADPAGYMDELSLQDD